MHRLTMQHHGMVDNMKVNFPIKLSANSRPFASFANNGRLQVGAGVERLSPDNAPRGTSFFSTNFSHLLFICVRSWACSSDCFNFISDAAFRAN